jgi:hypothetical protein
MKFTPFSKTEEGEPRREEPAKASTKQSKSGNDRSRKKPIIGIPIIVSGNEGTNGK